LMAYSLDTLGRRRYEIRFRDITTGEELDDVTAPCGRWGRFFADDRTFFYVRKDRSLRNARVFRH
ncbi:MAG: hypothetical protein IPO60_09965, partial [Flavobacteriales bacterium]|nr:hypothetical protein [Flavobacteriales bacterium]